MQLQYLNEYESSQSAFPAASTEDRMEVNPLINEPVWGAYNNG